MVEEMLRCFLLLAVKSLLHLSAEVIDNSRSRINGK